MMLSETIRRHVTLDNITLTGKTTLLKLKFFFKKKNDLNILANLSK